MNRTAAPARSRRDPWFDNIKLTLVTLVVVGHTVPLTQGDHASQIYGFLYFWHVPAFVLITGYLSRSFTWTRARLWSLVTTVAVPYVVFEGLLGWYRIAVLGEELHQLWINPHWPMWYLAAMFWWRLLTPLLLRLPLWAACASALAASLGSGLLPAAIGEFLDLYRTLGLLPFFVVGLRMGPRVWALLRPRPAAIAGVVTLVGLWWLAGHREQWIETEWLYYRASYDEFGSSLGYVLVARVAMIGLALIGTGAFFTLVPRGWSWFTSLGPGTLVVYLWHGFFIITAKHFAVPRFSGDAEIPALILNAVAGVTLALVLAAPPVARVLNVPVDPIGTWKRRRATPPR